MYHKLILVGNLGRDPERSATPTGTPVTNFSVATAERWTGSDGQVQERKVWWRVNAFGVLGKVCYEHLKAGRGVLVEGVLHADPDTGAPPLWVGQDGKPHTSFEVRAQVIKFLAGSKPENGHHASTPAQPLPEDVLF